VVLSLLIAAGVLLMAPPALMLGLGGLRRRSGHYSSDVGADRASLVLLITVRALVLLLVFALSAVVLVSTVGAALRDVELHGMVYIFFVLDALLVALVLLTFGRRDRRRVRRRATPAGR
jgi:type IV secretory pathway VirB3-like protein